MRLFFAAWPPAATAAALHEWSRALRGRPTATENIHLTLVFLGDADPARATASARRVKAHRHELPIEVAKFWPKNEIVWAGPRELPGPLESLVRALKLELYRDEFILEQRPFAAHVTLLRRAEKPAALPPLPGVRWPVNEFLLVRSRTSAKGPAYEPVERFLLG